MFISKNLSVRVGNLERMFKNNRIIIPLHYDINFKFIHDREEATCSPNGS